MNHKVKELNFENIVTLLQYTKYKGASDNIKVLKGKYFLPTTWKELVRKVKLMIAR